MNYYIILFLLFFHIETYSQIQKKELPKETIVGIVKNGGSIKIKLSYYIDENSPKDTTYSLVYNDANYTTIDVFETVIFAETGNTLNDLYALLKESLNAENGKETSFELGKTNVIVITKISMGVRNILVSFSKNSNNSGFLYLTKREVDKLFNKTKTN
jgi:hypothetical protein